MAEAISQALHCPSCSTRYRLLPQRVKPSLRRAKCFSCGSVFPIGDEVQRLLAPAAQGTAATFTTEDLEALLGVPPEPPVQPPSLTPGDLEGVEAEILEKTLVNVPSPMPEAKARLEPEAAPEPGFEPSLSGYASARDAINKLFADAPVAAPALKSNQEPAAMDMEATLSALESTLGGAPETRLGASAEPLGDRPTAHGQPMEPLTDPSSSTLRISHAELQASLEAPLAGPSSGPTEALKATDLAAPKMAALASDSGSELLRLKIGEEIYGNLTMPQLITWVEEGRVLENHLVARQHSENWLEAHKVPGLRPVFDRLRRERSGAAPSLDSGIAEAASKKGLFSGLFGRN